jgi:hypothetical protein
LNADGPVQLAGQAASSFSCERRWLNRLLHGLLPSKTPRKVVSLLPGIIDTRHNANSVISLDQDDRQQPSRIGFCS